MNLPPGTRVRHDRYGEGTVLPPSGHTHPAYELVEVNLGRLRLRRERLTVLENTEPEQNGGDGGQ